jgi:hypothetical protein
VRVRILLAIISVGVTTACSGGADGGPSPSGVPPSVTVTFSPPAGSAIPNGTSLSFEITERGGKGNFYSGVALLRDDGVYSRCLVQSYTENTKGGEGGTGWNWTRNDADWNDPLNFAAGSRVNLVVLMSTQQNPCPGTGVGAPPIDHTRDDFGRTVAQTNWLVGGIRPGHQKKVCWNAAPEVGWIVSAYHYITWPAGGPHPPECPQPPTLANDTHFHFGKTYTYWRTVEPGQRILACASEALPPGWERVEQAATLQCDSPWTPRIEETVWIQPRR